MTVILTLIALIVIISIAVAICLLKEWFGPCRVFLVLWCLAFDAFVIAMACLVIKAIFFW